MSDIADKAQALIELQFQSNLNKALARQHSAPRINADGNRICIDCEVRIPVLRRKVVPHAVRCVVCQQEAEVQ